MQHLTEGLNLEEQIGQLMVVGFPGPTITPEIIDLIQNHHVGGIVFFTRNLKNPHQIRELTQKLQSIAREAGHRYPLLISVDQENGIVRRFGDSGTVFPGNMALGAIDSEELTYNIAQAAGQELKALGINMNLAPVADVNNNPANPVIGVRSFGEDPHQVARLTAAMVRGYQETGVISCLKHFPGHGDTAVDSHLALPIIPFSLERLEQLELIPFKKGIEAGADSIMIAHLYLPELMSEGETLPSTLSPVIVRDLLRQKLGYQGVIITDCLEMNAVSETSGVEKGAVIALQAGNDLILVSHRYDRQKGSIEAIKAALTEGQLSPGLITEAAERVLQLKARMLSWDNLPAEEDLAVIGSTNHRHLRDRAYELSTTVVRDQQHLLPLKLTPEERVLIVLPQTGPSTQAADTYHFTDAFVEQFRQRHAKIEIMSISSSTTQEQQQKIDLIAGHFAMIIVVTVNANLDTHQGEVVQRLIQTGTPLIGLAIFNPYDLLAFPQLQTYLVTYEYTPPALAAAVRVLFGESEAKGKLPVSLPGLYPLLQP